MTKQREAVTFGADPELFLRDTDTGDVAPACGLFGGTKGEPAPIRGLPTGFGVQEDNVMLEYNIPPAIGRAQFASQLWTAYEAVQRLVHTKGYEIDVNPSRVFGLEKLQHPSSRIFGCSPDFNAYARGEPLPPIDDTILRHEAGEWRFAGGHVHIGYTAELPHFVVAAFADIFLSLPMLGFDLQGERRKHYGTAGRYRPTSYGIEYRTLSNAWVHTPRTTTELAMNAENLGSFINNCTPEIVHKMYVTTVWGDVREAINTEDAHWGAQIFSDFSERLDEVRGN